MNLVIASDNWPQQCLKLVINSGSDLLEVHRLIDAKYIEKGVQDGKDKRLLLRISRYFDTLRREVVKSVSNCQVKH